MATGEDYQHGARPPKLDDGVEIVTVSYGDDPLHDTAEKFLYRIYRESGFCDESPRSYVEELEPWREAGVFHLAIDTTNDTDPILGMLRTTIADLDTLQIGGFDLDDGIEAHNVCEISSLASAPSKRGTGVIENLYVSAWRTALAANSPWLAGMVDPWLLDVIIDAYGMPFTQIGKPRVYMGGDGVIPIGLDLDGDTYIDLSENRPAFWDWVLEWLTPEEAARHNMPDPRGIHTRA